MCFICVVGCYVLIEIYLSNVVNKSQLFMKPTERESATWRALREPTRTKEANYHNK